MIGSYRLNVAEKPSGEKKTDQVGPLLDNIHIQDWFTLHEGCPYHNNYFFLFFFYIIRPKLLINTNSEYEETFLFLNLQIIAQIPQNIEI